MKATVQERLEGVRERIGAACARSGRAREAVDLLAVSKRFPPEAVTEFVSSGHRLFGESRVQEAVAKAEALDGTALEWHFIGHLQKNKIRKVLPICEVIHSIDSLDLARQIDRIAGETGTFPRGFLEVNIAGDGAKFGFSADEVERCLEELISLPRLEIRGLMTIPPLAKDPEQTRRHFEGLRQLRDQLEERGGLSLPGLSMGMSHDFEVAIEEGATIVRVGSALFGKRPPN